MWFSTRPLHITNAEQYKTSPITVHSRLTKAARKTPTEPDRREISSSLPENPGNFENPNPGNYGNRKVRRQVMDTAEMVLHKHFTQIDGCNSCRYPRAECF
ncbi:uncharacterized protein LOC108089711 [Drosophila ficusphila]|uniref:uncharacterized protein LOC108089711 n=1 Tax=Drosophila ficusphila TaxID=30025 RepID=UPI0007E7654D|nr:uncharacterized protein LOC108089711 [Drosophila ficusphila]